MKARDVIAEARPNQFTIALSQASRVPAWMHRMGLAPVKLGLDLRGGVYLVYQVDVQGAVKQLLDRHEQDFRAALRNATRGVSGRRRSTIRTIAVRVLFRDADSFAKGKAAILADSRNLNLTDVTVGGAPALELQLTPQEIKERQDYAVSAEHRHSAQSPQQPRTRGLRAAGGAARAWIASPSNCRDCRTRPK